MLCYSFLRSADQGFAWVNEGRTHTSAKWGYTATEVGSTIDLKLDTRLGTKLAFVPVTIGFLKSYEKMGKGRITCVEGEAATGCTSARGGGCLSRGRQPSQPCVCPYMASGCGGRLEITRQ